MLSIYLCLYKPIRVCVLLHTTLAYLEPDLSIVGVASHWHCCFGGHALKSLRTPGLQYSLHLPKYIELFYLSITDGICMALDFLEEFAQILLGPKM